MGVSPLVRFGTPTWAYEGWQGLDYQKPYAKGRFKKDCLAEYARYEGMGNGGRRLVAGRCVNSSSAGRDGGDVLE